MPAALRRMRSINEAHRGSQMIHYVLVFRLGGQGADRGACWKVVAELEREEHCLEPSSNRCA